MRDRRSRGCQSFAATDKDQRTTPASRCGQPCRPRPRFPRSKCHMVIWNSTACSARRFGGSSIRRPSRRDLEVPFVLTEERARLSNVTNKIEGQKVRFVDDLVELKGAGFVELRPREAIAHLCDDAARQVSCGRHLQPGACRGSSQEDQGVPCDGRLLDLFLRKVGGKPDRTGHRRAAVHAAP